MLSLRGQMVFLFAFGLVACHRAGPAQNGPITTADAVWRLSREVASAHPQVHLSGTVTVVDQFNLTMFIQDRTGATFIDVHGIGTKFPVGTSVRIDESYIRESVLYPQAKIVAGYDRIMPTFKGLISDEGMLKLIEYIKSLGNENGANAPARNLSMESPDLQKTGTMAVPMSEMKAPAAAKTTSTEKKQ